MADIRRFEELRDTGLLWLVNAAVLHPRGYALRLHFDSADGLPSECVGWSLVGDGLEPWGFDESVDQFRAVEELLEQTQQAALADAAAEREQARYETTRPPRMLCEDPGVREFHAAHRWTRRGGQTYVCPGVALERCGSPAPSHEPHLWAVPDEAGPRAARCPGQDGAKPDDTEQLVRVQCQGPANREPHAPHRWRPAWPITPGGAWLLCPGTVPCGDHGPHLAHDNCPGHPGWCGLVDDHGPHDAIVAAGWPGCSPDGTQRVYRCLGGAVKAADAMGVRRVGALMNVSHAAVGLADAAVTGATFRPPSGPAWHVRVESACWQRTPHAGHEWKAPAPGAQHVDVEELGPFWCPGVDPKPGLTGDSSADLDALAAWVERQEQRARHLCSISGPHPEHTITLAERDADPLTCPGAAEPGTLSCFRVTPHGAHEWRPAHTTEPARCPGVAYAGWCGADGQHAAHVFDVAPGLPGHCAGVGVRS